MEIEETNIIEPIEDELDDNDISSNVEDIENNLIPPNISKNKIKFIYTNEADLLNMALFRMTAKQWQENNNDKKGNMRDYTSVEQLVVLANLETLNAEFIKQKIEPNKRLEKLNLITIEQLKLLLKYSIKKIKKIKK